MKIAEVKRILAKLGLINPLYQLVYTQKEISEMKKVGLLINPHDPKEKKKLRNSARKRQGGKSAMRKICELWCKWNMREINGDEFAYQFDELFKDEVSAEWRKVIKK